LRRLIGKFKENFVDVTPASAFRRIVTLDDGMTAVAKVAGGVPVRRVIATADMAAALADAKMHPGRAYPETVFASSCAGNDRRYGGAMPALPGHDFVLSVKGQ
jgi:hypothetical protein